MDTFQPTKVLPHHRNQLYELVMETQRIEKDLCSSGFVKTALIDELISMLSDIASRNQHIRITLSGFQWRFMAISIRETVYQVDKSVTETRNTIVKILRNRLRESRNCDEIRVRLCFLSIALRNLQRLLEELPENNISYVGHFDLHQTNRMN